MTRRFLYARITLALSPASPESYSKIPTSVPELGEFIHDLCDRGQAFENVQPTVSKEPYLAKSSDMVYLRRRSIGNKTDDC